MILKNLINKQYFSAITPLDITILDFLIKVMISCKGKRHSRYTRLDVYQIGPYDLSLKI